MSKLIDRAMTAHMERNRITSELRVKELTVRQEGLLKQAADLIAPVLDPLQVAKMTVADLVAKDAAYQKLMDKMSSIHLKSRVTDEPLCALVVIHCERHKLVGITDGAKGMYQHNLFDVACKTI